MNFGKINMFLLIAVIVILAAVLFFLFVNKKETSKQNDALAVILKNMLGGNSPTQQSDSSAANSPIEEEEAEPTEEDWKMIYAISEKIYFKKPRTVFEKEFQKKFDSYIQKDIEFCNEFYPIVEKLVKGEELSEAEKAFYEANKEQADDEVEHRKSSAESLKSQAQNSNSQDPAGKELEGAKPPMAVEERNKKILSFFTDGIPKAVKNISELLKKETGHDYAKNIYRVLGSLEGKFLTPYKINNITYYCLPEWFDGRKLKPEFKNKIAA